ncbi:MAG TPA: hypothetical protein ENI13_01940 [candidate division CPR3 bacterium]|uniref:Chemotaxis methyl-accepting receptor HlyB-like 4HB MCP domain-containing protein n=1 Tax=candidate division CPR3 bacterium TaxID=2268181 RepID=A0A7C1SXH5_UNCC3|nr:hypothetical protein [candidate division CPR3 bacterium]
MTIGIFKHKLQIIGKSTVASLGLLILIVGAVVYIVNVSAQTNVNADRIEYIKANIMPREVLNEKFQGIYDRLDMINENLKSI